MMFFKRLCFCLLFITNSIVLFGQQINISKTSNSDDLIKLLEKSFITTFSSSHEFANSYVFQCLNYNLAEISEIRKITPYPQNVQITFEGLEELEEYIDSKKRKILRFNNLDVSCYKVQYFGMAMEEIVFSFPFCSIEKEYLEKGRIRFSKAKCINLKVKVSENNLLSVMKLYSKSSALSSVKINIDIGKVKVTGKVKMGFIIAEFRLKGYTKLVSSKKVNFICDKLTLNGISQPRAFIAPIMNYINPVFDSSKVWVNLNVKKMELKKGFVETLAIIEKKEICNAN